MNETEPNIRSDLYQWKKPDKFNSKLNTKIKESDNIQLIHQWLRKIEDVSETAINKALNPKVETQSNQIKRSKSNFCLNEKRNLTQIQDQVNKIKDPYGDAHDLISEWITDKIRLDLDDDFYDYVNVTEVNKFSNNEKFLKDLKSELLDSDTNASILDIKGIDYDKYDEAYLTKDILNKIMRKNVVDSKKLMYTDASKPKTIDTQLKLEMRHQAVKDNREKRAKELELRRKEKLERKEIEFQARQMVLKEENEKKMRENLEKQLIEQEAQKLRIEMAEKRIKDEEMRRQQRELDKYREEREQQELLKIKKNFEKNDSENIIESKRNEMAEKRANDLVESFLRVKRLRVLQKSFSVWYGMVLDQRLKNGKANALADWRLSYKVFNGWKKIVIVERTKKQQQDHQNEIRRENLKNAKANEFYKKTILLKVFNSWNKHVKSELLLKKLNNDKLTVKNRMQSFLNAAKEETTLNSELTNRSENDNTSYIVSTNRSRSTENLSSNYKTRVLSAKRGKNSSKMNSHRENNDDNDEEFKAYMNKKSDVDLEKKVKNIMQPWLKGPSTQVFDNRFKAQEKLLSEQTKMIKEQQKMIEELKYQQSQLAFKQQISLLEEIKSRQIELEKMQKAQFAQEKKLIREQALMSRNTPRKENNSVLNEDKSNSSENVNEKEESEVQANEKNSARVPEKKFDQITIKMQERAKQREMQKKERDEKRKKVEQEKLELLKAQQEEKLKIEEEEKKKKMEELREKKRIQKMQEEKKNLEIQKENELNQKADDFYKKYLLRYYCMNGFKKLIDDKNQKNLKAEKHYNNGIMKIILFEWKTLIKAEVIVKQKKADEFYRKLLLKHAYYDGIKRLKQSMQIGSAKANRFYSYNLKLKLYKHWKVYTAQEKEKNHGYEIMIKEHNTFRIKSKFFKIWKEYPNEARKQRAREKRLDELRSKVKQMIPDYDVPGSSLT